ncbi:zinc finger CHY domain protein [Fimbriimonas ginsengisoli Gsoil 348]|uniref:Zinc finger CHY domain protein n=1 Tax=Fimbriimonas ginsengisoli Gsoil 348 TaxID=661478 RepID=A0A068NN47_FIMGI|nr:zinc finger CHY domain protein [Fimbriimonas ginsengisoli Gsoil 348]
MALIRRARLGDGGPLCDLFFRSVNVLGAGDYSPDQLAAWTSRINPERLERRLLSTVAFVAEENGRPVGFGSLDPAHGELDFLYVHPESAGRGLGRQLAEAIEAEAALRGFSEVHLTASLNAVSIYERLGYGQLERFSKTIDRVEVPCVRMSKRLHRERNVHGTLVRGLAVGSKTECAHYHSQLDVIAIRFKCCGEFYPCYQCHTAVSDHPAVRWGKDDLDAEAILCGACGTRLSIRAYLDCASRCPACAASFNPGCANHHTLYFSSK